MKDWGEPEDMTPQPQRKQPGRPSTTSTTGTKDIMIHDIEAIVHKDLVEMAYAKGMSLNAYLKGILKSHIATTTNCKASTE